MRVDQPGTGILIIDGLMDEPDLYRCSPAPEWFGVQRLGGTGPRWAARAPEHARRDDASISSLIWMRLGPHLPPLQAWCGRGNEPRFDLWRGPVLTVLLYLPTPPPCLGGETVSDGAVVPAVAGRAAVFDHRLIHEGRPVESGEKVVLRTEVLAFART